MDRTAAVGYRVEVSDGEGTSIGWRLLWGLVGGGLTATVLSVSGLGLTLPMLVAASVAGALVTALVGPLALELLPFI